MKTLKEIFNSDYNKRLLIDGVLKETFGDLFTEYEFAENFLRNADDRERAQNAGITSVEKIGNVSGFDTPLSVFEITLEPSVRIKYSRVNIQKFLRSVLYGESAFLIFHYEDLEDNDWRFSFLHVEKGNTTAAKRFTYLLGKAHKARTVAERFEKLKEQILEQRHGVINDQVLFDAFSVEALSDEFFNKYKTIYANFIQYITGKRVVKTGSKWEEKILHEPDTELYAAFGKDDKRIRDYVKKLMGRITFLYFVQEKRWFNNDQNYLQHLFENSTPEHQNDFLDCVLEPFFYTVLNTEKTNRKQAFEAHNNNLRPSEVKWDESLLDQWKEIPFLNGGLFERDENDILRTKFPPQFFKNGNGYDENFVGKIPQKDYPWERIPGIFDLFSQYNFTIDENDPDDAEVGIDPEMLGKIFENLLEDNKDKGAFYTPKEIVQYMCRESLIAYLQTDAKDDAHKERLRKFVTTHDASVLENPEYVRRKIKDIKVCDPAIGSGAFPMGMLNELVSCSEALDMHIDKNSNRAEIKKHIIQNSIYGVDIERGAVDIARLRFWLSLVIDEEKAVPLPNLDYKIMQGNSLLEQYEGIDLSKLQINVNQTTVYEPQKDLFGRITDGQLKMTFTQETTVNNLQQLLKDYFYETKHSEKTKLKKEITKIVNDHILYNIELRKTQVNRLIGEDEVFIRAQENKIADLQTQFPNQKLSPTLTAKFDAEIQKARRRIADNETQLQKYDNALAEMLKEDFLSSNQQFFLWHTWFADVFNRSSNQGFDVVIGNPPYGAKLSNEEKAKYRMIFPETQFKIDTYSLFILQSFKVFSNKGLCFFIIPNTFLDNYFEEAVRDRVLGGSIIEINDLTDKVFNSAVVHSMIFGFSNQNNPSNVVKVNDSPILSSDFKTIPQIFFLEQPQRSFSIRQYETNDLMDKLKENSKRLIEVLDIRQAIKSGNDSKYIKTDKLADNYKPILRGKDIKKFTTIAPNLYIDYGKHLACPRHPQIFEQPKILIREAGATIVATLDEANYYIMSSLYNAILIDKSFSLRYLLGLIDSKLFQYLMNKLTFEKTKGAFTKAKIFHYYELPIRIATATQQQPIIDLVDEILTKKKQNSSEDTTDLEGKIDKLVYELYGLTDEEIKVVEGK